MQEKNLLLIFTRNPELGKCKTRLAASIGDFGALKIYTFLLTHTVLITENLKVAKQVHYSMRVRENDLWDDTIYDKKQQEGTDLGLRMEYAFQQGFKDGYKNIIIIGSDMYDLSQADLELAFQSLDQHDFVIGPAEDGGYYLLGMKSIDQNLFRNKEWGTNTVLFSTKNDLKTKDVKFLDKRNDIDILDDIKDIPFFKNTFLNH